MKAQFAKPKTLALLAIPAGLGVAAAIIYSRYRRDLKAAKARVSAGSRLANTAAGPVEYADIGEGAPVLAIHGAGGGFDQGLELARPLLKSSFRVIAPSRFGYLRTPLPKDASPMAQADAHAALLDVLQVDKAFVLGVSAGAPSAMQFCLRHPERCHALVLIVPLAYSGNAATEQNGRGSALREFLINSALSSDFVFWSMSKLARDSMLKTILGTPPEDLKQVSPEERARVEEVLKHISPVSRRKLGLQNESAVARSLVRYDLERLSVPTLICSVEDCLYNTYAAARYTAEHVPGARFVGYRKGGHLAAGHQQELWSEIKTFLKVSASTAA